MGITERKEREKEKRRNDIIDAAERVFFSKGQNPATMDDVAEEAELSKGTLYLYFKSKEELSMAIKLRGLKILGEIFVNAIKKYETGIEKIKAIGQAYFQFYKDYPDYFNTMIYSESCDLDLMNKNSFCTGCHDQGDMALNIVSEALRAGIADGTIRPEIDPIKTAHILWGQSSGIIQLIASKGEHIKNEHGLCLDELMLSAFDLICYSLKK